MNKAVFLDRDGTINVEKHYLYKITDFEFIPGALDGMKLLSNAGYLLIIITNQSGIARGYYTEDDYQTLNRYMLQECEKNGIKITDTYYCPHLPEARIKDYSLDCECRKPKTGLFRQAIEKYNIDLSTSYAIGDKLRDLSICEKTACMGYLIDGFNSENGELPAGVKAVSSLAEAAEDILKTKG